jgi:hypothetical protein
MIINDTPKVKVVNIVFDDNTSHYAIFRQIVDGLRKAGYASKKEILEIFQENID